MKVNCYFDKESRSIILTPEDDLERLICKELAERCEKGSQLKIKRVEEGEIGLVVELKVNGH